MNKGGGEAISAEELLSNFPTHTVHSDISAFSSRRYKHPWLYYRLPKHLVLLTSKSLWIGDLLLEGPPAIPLETWLIQAGISPGTVFIHLAGTSLRPPRYLKCGVLAAACSQSELELMVGSLPLFDLQGDLLKCQGT